MCKLGAIIKIFITHLLHLGAIIKFWDKIYTPDRIDVGESHTKQKYIINKQLSTEVLKNTEQKYEIKIL